MANNGPLGVEGNPAGTNPVYTIQKNVHHPKVLLSFPPAIDFRGKQRRKPVLGQPELPDGLRMSFNLNVQKSLGKKVVLQVGYVGRRRGVC